MYCSILKYMMHQYFQTEEGAHKTFQDSPNFRLDVWFNFESHDHKALKNPSNFRSKKCLILKQAILNTSLTIFLLQSYSQIPTQNMRFSQSCPVSNIWLVPTYLPGNTAMISHKLRKFWERLSPVKTMRGNKWINLCRKNKGCKGDLLELDENSHEGCCNA